MIDPELEDRLDRIEKAVKDNDGFGCGTIVIILLLLCIVHLLGGC